MSTGGQMDNVDVELEEPAMSLQMCAGEYPQMSRYNCRHGQSCLRKGWHTFMHIAFVHVYTSTHRRTRTHAHTHLLAACWLGRTEMIPFPGSTTLECLPYSIIAQSVCNKY